MENFEKRKDRFEFFESFENPLLNITFKLEVPEFLSFCKKHNYPPFHFFLFHLFESLNEIENFRYRLLDGKITLVEKFIASYTVLNQHNDLNFTRFELSSDLNEFIARSLKAREEAVHSKALIHTGHDLPLHTVKNYIFITSIPWLDFTSIQHPVFKFKSADIPSIAWGKFTTNGNVISMPFSVQAHHGFVDGYHVHLLGETLKQKLAHSLTEK